jgi:hypothetical protein
MTNPPMKVRRYHHPDGAVVATNAVAVDTNATEIAETDVGGLPKVIGAYQLISEGLPAVNLPMARKARSGETPAPSAKDPHRPPMAFGRVFRVEPGATVDVGMLTAFLVEGGLSPHVLETVWDPDAMVQLGQELSYGEAMLGLDHQGNVKRVVSVAKPLLYDGSDLLVEAFQSFPQKGKAYARHIYLTGQVSARLAG